MKKMPLLKQGFWLLGLMFLLYACQPESVVETIQVEITRVVTETVVEEGEMIEVTRVVMVEPELAAREGEEAAAATAVPPDTPLTSQMPTQRLIIKDGRLTIVVDDTETAVNSATNLIVELGGYIISQNLHDDTQGYRFATMRLAVPVTQFEFAMQSLRGLGQVTNESSSGEDVTDEFVDLNSRLTNLEMTRDRLRSFLDEAENVTETLLVNDELKRVEEEIAVIQGRLNFLQDRAAFSTIDLNIQPWIPTPTATATATATPTPTATPLPTAEIWRPGDTVQVAAVQLQDTAQETADFALYNSIVCGPWLLLFLLVGLPGWRLARRLGLMESVQRVASRHNRHDSSSLIVGGDEIIEEENDEEE